MNKQELEQILNMIDTAYQEVEKQHPYKQSGNRDSYSEYNEGWSDACDALRNKINQNITLNNVAPLHR